MKKSENFNPSQLENVIFEMIKTPNITIPKKASFWRTVIDSCLNRKTTPSSNEMELTVYLNPLRRKLYLSIGQSYSYRLDSNQTESPNPDDVEIKRLNQLSFVDRVEIFKDENRIVIYPKNRNINSVVVNNIALTK